MFILDSMVIGGLRFVFEKIANVVDQEMNDETRLREELLAAQMRLELGEMSEQDFAALERDLLRRLREIREEREGANASARDLKGAGVEITFGGDEDGR